MRVIASPTEPLVGNQVASALKPKRIEIISTGIDEALQGYGSTPEGSVSWPGLRIPSLATPTASPHLRYLFQLCSASFSEGDTGRIVGLRHGWSLGFLQTTRVVEQWVENPLFKGNDFNVSWHLRKLTINEPRRANPGAVLPTNALAPLQNLAFKTSDTPALLFTPPTVAVAGNPFYTALSAYTPPNRGRPWGRPIGGELGTFNDLKTKWQDAADWQALDIPFSGPCRIVFYASVFQSSTSRRTALTPPGTFFPGGLSAEEQFLLNFPNAIPWRVAGALAIELEDIGPQTSQFRSYEIDGSK